MKKMKLYILNLGSAWVESNYFIANDTAGTSDNPNAPHRTINTPFIVFLIDHPEAGWILYDTGTQPCWKDEWTSAQKRFARVEKPESTYMERQLELVGIEPKDVKHVILSHLHQDHTGNVKLFSGANFYVGRDEMAWATLSLLAMDDEQYDNNPFWVKNDVFLKVKSRTYIDRDTELFSNIELITLPGHSPCVLGMVMHLQNQTIIATSDAIHVLRNYNGEVQGTMYDSLGFSESINKIKCLEKKYKAMLIFGHDIEQFNGLKKAPAYYD